MEEQAGEYSSSLWEPPVQPAVVVAVASLVLQVRGSSVLMHF